MLGVVALVVGLHAFYWFGGGPDFAARYWYLIIVPCVALDRARPHGPLRQRDARRDARPWSPCGALSAAALLTWVPWRSVEKYHHFRNMSADMREFVAAHPMDSSLVLVRGRRHPDYHEAALENPLDLTDRAARDLRLGSHRPRCDAPSSRAYPDRARSTSSTVRRSPARGFRIVAGPLPAGSLADQLPSSSDIPTVLGAERRDGTQQRTP